MNAETLETPDYSRIPNQKTQIKTEYEQTYYWDFVDKGHAILIVGVLKSNAPCSLYEMV